MIDYLPEHIVGIGDVIREVADYYRIRIDILEGHDRHRTLSFARHVAMYLCRQLELVPSYPEIGCAFGGRDHSTVIDAVRKVTALLRKDPATRKQIEHFEKKLGIAAVKAAKAKRRAA